MSYPQMDKPQPFVTCINTLHLLQHHYAARGYSAANLAPVVIQAQVAAVDLLHLPTTSCFLNS